MTEDAPGTGPQLVTSDRTLAKIIAYRASLTEGVIRLQPRLTRVLGRAALGVTRRATTRLASQDPLDSASDFDTAGIEIQRDPSTGTVGISIRIIAATTPPVLTTAAELHTRIAHDLRTLAALEHVEVCVQILDIEEPPTTSRAVEAVALMQDRAATPEPAGPFALRPGDPGEVCTGEVE